MLISDIPVLSAHHHPDRVAIRYQDRAITFRELRDRVRRLSQALLEVAAPGDRVAILAENCPEYIECYYAVPGSGMALTFLNYRLSARELTYILTNAEPSVLVTEPGYLATVEEIRPDIPSIKHVVLIGGSGGDIGYEELLRRGSPQGEPEARPGEDEVAWLLYTSGTTGLPKGAMLSHRNVAAAVLNSAARFETEPAEVCLFPWPLYHVAGYLVPLYHMYGFTLVLMRSYDPGEFLASIERYRVTTASAAPTMLNMLLQDPRIDAHDLSSLRGIGYGAASMPAEVLRRAMDRWPGVGFNTVFGMTELSGNIMYFSRPAHEYALEENPELLRSVGQQLPLVRVRVVDDDMNDVPVGEAGELVVQGEQVTLGYWRNDTATREAFRGGWFHSGDIAKWDGNGFLYIIDRKKDMIVTGGENVYSREVEEVLYQHPAIAEAAVIGLPDEMWGEQIVAVVQTRSESDASQDELIAFCRERLASYKKPRHVVFTGELPKNASGKILKRELRDRLRPEPLPSTI
jgi:acyl-CoA synthetase (AMP-forming)/AMP-acid ligase II